ncbi:hypothetical protein ACRRTK_005296 [Alexandromys fortis]
MLQFLLGFTLGNVVGMYLAQNYDMPNLAKKLEEIKKDLEAKKKPPSSRCLPSTALWTQVPSRGACLLHSRIPKLCSSSASDLACCLRTNMGPEVKITSSFPSSCNFRPAASES